MIANGVSDSRYPASFSRNSRMPTLTVSMLRTHCTHFRFPPLQSLVMDPALCFARLEVLCRRAEAVVGVAEFGWNAAARGTTGELDVVAPCAASRRAADAVRGALRVHGGRDGVPGRIVPIAAPLVNVLAHVEQAVAIRLAEAGGFRAVMPTAGGNRRQRVAPRVEALRRAATSGEFPLGLGGQAHGRSEEHTSELQS